MARKKTNRKLSHQQEHLLKNILAFRENRGRYPSPDIIAEFYGITVKAARDRITALYKRGLLEKYPAYFTGLNQFKIRQIRHK